MQVRQTVTRRPETIRADRRATTEISEQQDLSESQTSRAKWRNILGKVAVWRLRRNSAEDEVLLARDRDSQQVHAYIPEGQPQRPNTPLPPIRQDLTDPQTLGFRRVVDPANASARKAQSQPQVLPPQPRPHTRPSPAAQPASRAPQPGPTQVHLNAALRTSRLQSPPQPPRPQPNQPLQQERVRQPEQTRAVHFTGRPIGQTAVRENVHAGPYDHLGDPGCPPFDPLTDRNFQITPPTLFESGTGIYDALAAEWYRERNEGALTFAPKPELGYPEALGSNPFNRPADLHVLGR